MRLFLEHLAWGEPPLRHGARQAAFLVAGRSAVAKLIRSHCVSAGVLADRLGLPPTVRTTIQHVFERWDGTGLPDGARGAAIPLLIQVMQLADVVEVHLRERGPTAAGSVVRERTGTQFDPAVAEALFSLGEAGLVGMRPGDAWDAALDLAPDRDALLAGDALDELLRATGDFADLKVAVHGGALPRRCRSGRRVRPRLRPTATSGPRALARSAWARQ